MPADFARLPRPDGPDEPFELSPELRDYVAACLRAARPSRSRSEALAALGAASVDDAWELAGQRVDWTELEAEAERQGCTVADIVFDRAGRGPDPL
jgi:hypothetical protein